MNHSCLIAFATATSLKIRTRCISPARWWASWKLFSQGFFLLYNQVPQAPGSNVAINMQRDAKALLLLFFHKPWTCLLWLIVVFLPDQSGFIQTAVLKSILYNICAYCEPSVCVVSSIPGDKSIQYEIFSIWTCDLCKITVIRRRGAALYSHLYMEMCFFFLCKKLRRKKLFNLTTVNLFV